MKKFILISFIAAICLILVSCNNKEEFNGSPDDIPTAVVSSTFVEF